MQMIPNDPFSLSTSLPAFAQEQNTNPNPKPNTPPVPKKKRNLPGTPDPDAEVIALSPKTLMATNRFICEICNKGFQRDQNLQLHRRGHNLPWKLRQRSNKDVIKKKVYICPEKSCVHHDPSRALGDLTGIKKHFSRKHGEKKWKCEKCSKKYAVQSDWKAHTKTCGTREYKCDCGTLFSRKDSFITHRAFCDALAEESARITSVTTTNLNFKNEEGAGSMIGSHSHSHSHSHLQHGLSHGNGMLQNIGGGIPHPQFGSQGYHLDFNGIGSNIMEQQQRPSLSLWLNQGNPHNQIPEMGQSSGLFGSSGLSEIVQMGNANMNNNALIGSSSSMMSSYGVPASNSTPANLSLSPLPIGKRGETSTSSVYNSDGQNKQLSKAGSATPMSATALLQKAAQMGSTRSTSNNNINNNGSIFSASFGVMTSPSSSNSSFDQFLMHGQESEQGKMNILHHGGNSNSMEQVQHSNLTRDFLGVSGTSGPPQFLPQELAKFASSIQFTGNQ
ncbi:zinc finger protein JACKDAW-like [Vicia villosa]|uniref:zinc finger protein JACKDAW-like n=1 Tax=Vicia villosa TaxID=3911 RepID=UPI00273ABF54|nr:zinc finger protein JACKDAW-like [Vicia villosa]XP_058771126.1 zinc finger protein JACKDAW-like [Vicia villosa]